MIKFTSNYDFDFGIESVQLLKDPGNDLVKRASTKDLLKYEKTPGQEDLHVIALGSLESTGQNRNSDFWTADTCRRNHSQFKEAGRAIHRHHRNRKDDPKYGNIKASAYNEKMGRIELVIGLDKDKCAKDLDEFEKTGNLQVSMACFKGGVPVQLQDGSEKLIKDIVVGDKVITHKGNVGTVANTTNRNYFDTFVTFKACGLPESLTSTKEHLIWARPSFNQHEACPVCGKKFSSLKSHLWQKTDAQHQFALKNLKREFDSWIPASNLKIGDYVSTPFSTKVEGETTEAYAGLLGWYLAEGHFYESPNVRASLHCLDFTLNIKEEGYAKEIEEYLVLCGTDKSDVWHYTYPKSHKRIVRCHSITLANKLKEDGGKYSYAKCLSSRVKLWPYKYQKIVIEKWLEGDGHWDKTDLNLKGTTVSRQLMWDLCELAYRNGIIPKVSKHIPTKNKINRPSYVLTIIGDDADKLNVVKKNIDWVPASKKTYSRDMSNMQPWQKGQVIECCATRKNPFTYIEGNLVYRKILKISQETNTDTVYDITVPGDDSFIAGRVGVHNCKVPYDVCSICGHKAKDDKPGSRCEHIPDKLGEIMPDGKMVGMENPKEGRWFELSLVKRGADRIAFGLSKLASDVTYKPQLPSDYEKIYPDIHVPDDLIISKKAEEKREVLHKLSEMEKRVDMIARSAPKTSKDQFIKLHGHKLKHSPKIDDTSMDSLRKMEPSVVLKTLTEQGIIFKPEDFARYLFDKKVNPESINGMKTHLPHIFNKLEEDPGKAVNSETFDPNDNKAPEELKKLTSKLKEDHSLEEGPCVRRIMLISITGSLKPKEEKEATKEASDLEFAKQYGIYKLACANVLNEQGKLTDDMLMNMILQNY